MIKRILIANRGEIACRIIDTARRMGIETIAVYSEPDAEARHVTAADYSHGIGGDTASSSYLDQGKILKAAKHHKADAIHPGYGFLSENPEFAEAVAKAGLIFIGPTPEAIRAMGLKDQARQMMMEAGVPVVAGYDGSEQSPEGLQKHADSIGYPLMIKARAGGGGKGLRRVDGRGDFPKTLAATKREALASFGDEHVVLEQCIATPRHIEVQIFADTHGNIVHLFERDCTLQRRHQKVIEEAPAFGMTSETRDAMTQAAITAAKAINYHGAGTVEFIAIGAKGGGGELTPDGFWFMEMNTRLQVEHPTTEMVTGFDLVEWQIRIANGEPLPATQDDITCQGHAIEARIYAEDPASGFLPASGAIHHASFPDDVRVDHGINNGVNRPDFITPFYDPMIAKVIAKGQDRPAALANLYQALGDVHIIGATTNTDFLQHLLSHDDVAEMKIDTTWIDRHLDELTISPTEDDRLTAMIALVHATADGGFGQNDAFRIWGNGQMLITFMLNKETIERRIILTSDAITVIGGKQKQIFTKVERKQSGQIAIHHHDGITPASWVEDSGQISLNIDGRNILISRIDLRASQNLSHGDSRITAPMTGIISSVNVKAGDEVKAGEVLIRMEAMKMEHDLTAPCAGRVVAVNAEIGSTVDDGTILIELDGEDD